MESLHKALAPITDGYFHDLRIRQNTPNAFYCCLIRLL